MNEQPTNGSENINVVGFHKPGFEDRVTDVIKEVEQIILKGLLNKHSRLNHNEMESVLSALVTNYFKFLKKQEGSIKTWEAYIDYEMRVRELLQSEIRRS